MEGVTFYLKPDFSKITPKLFIFVLGQVFFALSLGFGVLITPSSLFKQRREPYSHSGSLQVLQILLSLCYVVSLIFPSLFTRH